MRRRTLIVAVASVLAVVCAVTVFFVLDFKGYLDQGTYEVLKSETSPDGKLAILTRRYDHQALNGDEYFVLIADHRYSTSELRRALHSPQPIFVADQTFDFHWISPRELTIECHGCGITRADIDSQRFTEGAIGVRYVGFP